jgi:putative transposase
MRRTYKHRLYPTKQQERLLEQQLEECRWLYNHLLAAQRDAWRGRQDSLRLNDQQATLPALKAKRPALAEVNSQVLQNAAVRIDLAFQAFFRRAPTGETPGYPRSRGRGRYTSITFLQAPSGCTLDAEAKHLRLHGASEVKVILHRLVEGTPKTATIQRSSAGKWRICFSCECDEPPPLPAIGQQVGIDVALKTFAGLSTDTEIANPRFFHREERARSKAQHRLSKEEQGTPERVQRRKVVARAHERTRWRRGDFTHQHSRRIANQVDLIAVEDWSVNRMVQNHWLAKSMHDGAWSQCASLLSSQAAWAARNEMVVNPAYTSQECLQGGHRTTDLTLADRTYTCSWCGVVLDRDLNARLNSARVLPHALASA